MSIDAYVVDLSSQLFFNRKRSATWPTPWREALPPKESGQYCFGDFLNGWMAVRDPLRLNKALKMDQAKNDASIMVQR